MNLSLGKEYQKGKTKIFIRHPESLFSLEELRDRTVFSYANKIQRFLRRTAMRKYVPSTSVQMQYTLSCSTKRNIACTDITMN